MQPKLHMSMAWSYCRSTRHTSGARYHLEPMCIEVHLLKAFLLPKSVCSQADIKVFSAATFCLNFMLARSLKHMLLKPARSEHAFGIVRDNPKSQILALQSDVMSMLADFKSLCITLASCMNCRLVSVL